MALSNERSAADMSEEARTLSTTRVFDAPRELVWRMWTEPEHIKHWWGPRGFTSTIQSMDIRPGGEWTFVMHGPDGRNYRNEITYGEVVAPARLTYSHGPSPRFDVTVTLEEHDGKTTLTMRSVFESASILRQVIETYGADKGMHETLDRLGEQLANDGAFSISRVFDAPRDLVFRVWTERDHLARWFGPRGFEVFHCTNDLRPDGLMVYGMRGPHDTTMWGRWRYREIVPPRLVVFVTSFSNPQGEITRAPFPGEWPKEMLTTVTFDEENGKTRVTVRSAAINASEAERATFDGAHASMNAGWGGTFDVLAEYLRGL